MDLNIFHLNKKFHPIGATIHTEKSLHSTGLIQSNNTTPGTAHYLKITTSYIFETSDAVWCQGECFYSLTVSRYSNYIAQRSGWNCGNWMFLLSRHFPLKFIACHTIRKRLNSEIWVHVCFCSCIRVKTWPVWHTLTPGSHPVPPVQP